MRGNEGQGCVRSERDLLTISFSLGREVVMRSTLRFVVAFMVAALAASTVACDGTFSPAVSPTPLTISVTSLLTVSPAVVGVNGPVALSWVTEAKSIQLDACHDGKCRVVPPSLDGKSAIHYPDAVGEWKYVLYNVVATPDMLVRVAEQTVTVQ